MDFSIVNAILGDISKAIGSVTVIAGAILCVSKKARGIVRAIVKKDSKSDETQEKITDLCARVDVMIAANADLRDAMIALLRNAITRIYYCGLDTQAISRHDKENVLKMYEVYQKFHGNTYIHSIVEDEIMKWKVT